MFFSKLVLCSLVALVSINQQINAQGYNGLYLNDQDSQTPPPSFLGNIFRTKGNISNRLGDVADNVAVRGRKFVRDRVNNLRGMLGLFGNRNPIYDRPNYYNPPNPMPSPPEDDVDIRNINLADLGIPMNKNDLQVIMKYTDENGKLQSLDLTSIFAQKGRNAPMPGSGSDLALIPATNDMTTEPPSSKGDTNVELPEGNPATNEI